MAGSGLFARLRILRDKQLTAANMLDRAHQMHGDVDLFHLMEPLPYPGLEGDRLSYPQLVAFVNRLGNVLRDAGMKRYDRVAVYKGNSLDYYFYALAIMKAGGIAVPVNAGMAVEGFSNYLSYTGSKILITDGPTFRDRLGGDAAAFPQVDTWVFPQAPDGFAADYVDLGRALPTASPELEPVPMAGDDDALIAHTSGTTGFPKGVLLSSGALVEHVKAGARSAPLTRNDRQLYAWPANHLISHTSLMGSTLGNIPVWFVESFDAKEVLDTIDRVGITQYYGFPDTYLYLYEHGLDEHSLDSMRLWFAVADASHEVHIREFTKKGALVRLFGRPLLRSMFVEALGTSEINFGALFRVAFSFSNRFDRYVGKPVSSGPDVKIADELGRELPPGEIGRLMIKGPTMFKGYWNAHDKLHGVMRDGWWWTGDLVYRDTAGRFYHLDREPDVIHTANGPVYSLVTEEVLMKHPDVSEAAVVAIPKGEASAPVAFVYAKPGRTVDPEECRSWTNERLEPGKGLERVVVVEPEDLVRGVTGKVLKRRLRENYADLLDPDREAASAAVAR